MNFSRLLLLASAVASTFPTIVFATSVAAVRTPTMVVIGGDSKAVRGNGKEYGTVCKTNVANNVVYGYAGFLGVRGTNFDVTEIVRRGLNGNGDAASRIDTVEKEITLRITEILVRMKTGDPLGYKKKVVGSPLVFGVVFAFMDGHTPRLAVFYLKGPQTDGEPTILKPLQYNCPGDCENGTGGMVLGSHDAANADIAKYPSLWGGLGLDRAIRHLIEDEVLDDPEIVGLPITVIRLSDSGIEWVEDSEECKQDRQKGTERHNPKE